ncbi:MAG: 30S ribosomal protein S4, partial [Candidatus Hadarchaeota archaeon]
MKRQRQKYQKPSHPWQRERMDSEDKLLREFGLRRKREIWKTQTILRNLRRQARRLLTASGPQARLETRQMLKRLQKLGLVGDNATLDDVLGLTVDKLLGRYLQILVHRKGMAKTPRQARQMVLHGKVKIGGRKVKVPSYLVTVEEEPKIECLVAVAPEAPAAPAAQEVEGEKNA